MEEKSKIKKKYFSIGVLFWLVIVIAMSYWVYRSQEKAETAPLVYQQNQSIIKPSKIIVSNQNRPNQLTNLTEKKASQKLTELTNSNTNVDGVQKNNNTINSKTNPISRSQSKNSDDYWIQISTYSKENRNIAEVKVAELKEVGVRGDIIQSPGGFKLVVGPYDDLNLANIEKNKIREKIGISDIFVYREENQ